MRALVKAGVRVEGWPFDERCAHGVESQLAFLFPKEVDVIDHGAIEPSNYPFAVEAPVLQHLRPGSLVALFQALVALGYHDN